jgi:hypothetical protein
VRVNIKDFIGRSIGILGGGRLCSSQSWHEVIGLVRVLTFAAVDVGQRGADLAKAKVRSHVWQAFQRGKRHPLRYLLRTQACEEMVRVLESKGKAESEVETALGTPLEFFVSSSTSAPDRPLSF